MTWACMEQVDHCRIWACIAVRSVFGLLQRSAKIHSAAIEIALQRGEACTSDEVGRYLYVGVFQNHVKHGSNSRQALHQKVIETRSECRCQHNYLRNETCSVRGVRVTGAELKCSERDSTRA